MVIAFVIHQSPVTNRRRRATPTVILPSSYHHPTFLYLYIYIAFFFIQMKHFSSLFVYTHTDTKCMLMTNTLEISNGSEYKPSPDTIKVRVRLYAENRFHRPLSNLRPDQRMAVIYCLHEQFQFPNGDIAMLLSCSKTTIWRELQASNVYKNSSEFMSLVRSIEDYILYIAKYIH